MKEKGKLIESPQSRQGVIDAAEQYADRFPANRRWVSIDAFVAGAKFEEAESPRQPQSSVPSHGAAEIGAGAENTAGVRDLTIRTPMPPTNCWCSNDSATCKKCWPERAGGPRQPSADSDARYAAEKWRRPAWVDIDAKCSGVALDSTLQPSIAPQEHFAHVQRFLQELYATMVDPIEQPQMTVAEMCEVLLKTAREQREQFAELREFSQHPVPAPHCPICFSNKRDVQLWPCSSPLNSVSTWHSKIEPSEHPVPAPETQTQGDNAELVRMAEKLLEWMPIYSKGSSGNIRQTNLRAAIEKFKVEHPGPAKGGGE